MNEDELDAGSSVEDMINIAVRIFNIDQDPTEFFSVYESVGRMNGVVWDVWTSQLIQQAIMNEYGASIDPDTVSVTAVIGADEIAWPQWSQTPTQGEAAVSFYIRLNG